MAENNASRKEQARIGRISQDQEKLDEIVLLKDKGYSNVAIGAKMGLNESSVRALLNWVKVRGTGDD